MINHPSRWKQKTKRKLLIGILLAIIIMFLVDLKDKRTTYENFLVREYSRFPVQAYDADQVSGSFGFPDMASLQNHFMTLDPALGYVP
ncbi:MAG: hypothetical protein JXA23_11465 [Bacteroidales bacterium]|nr:hypothetical protein [Bacteroidales bacterium]